MLQVSTLSARGLEICLGRIPKIPRTIDTFSPTFFSRTDVLENENLILNLGKAEELVLRLVDAYRKQSHMFSTVRAETHGPHLQYVPGYELARIKARGMDYLPGVKGLKIKVLKGGASKHILFLFFATLTDRRQKSGGDFGVYASHCVIFREYPELYSKKVLKWKKEDLATLLSKYKVGVPNQSAGYWLRCAKTLFMDYEGDPVKLYKAHGATVEGILGWRDNLTKEAKKLGLTNGNPLPGYGPKIASLYSLFLDAFGALPFPEDAFPVDVQVQRLFIQYEALVCKEKVSNALMEKVLRPFICILAKHHGIDKQEISHALWLLGSEGCNSCSKRLNAPLTCPIYEDCRGCQNTANYFAKGYWDPADTPMKKGASKVTFGMPEVRPTRYSRKRNISSPQVLLFPA